MSGSPQKEKQKKDFSGVAFGLSPVPRMYFVYVLLSLCGGFFPGQAVFNPWFASVGVMKSACKDDFPCDDQQLAIATIMQTVQTNSYFAFVPAGIAYDVLGAQLTCTIGAVGAAIAVFGVATGVFVGNDDLFYYSLLTVDSFVWMNSFGIFGLFFHVPERQAEIITLSYTCYNVGALLPLGMQLYISIVKSITGIEMSLVVVLLQYAASLLVYAWLCYKVTPSQSEYYMKAEEVLGIPLPKPRMSVRIFFKNIFGGFQVIFKDFLTSHWLVCVGTATLTLCTFTYTSMTIPWGIELFGTEADGELLGLIYTIANAGIGVFGGPLLGQLGERGGIPNFFLFWAALAGVTILCQPVKNWVVQTIGCVTSSTIWAAMGIVVNGYILKYPSPNRLGTVQGNFLVLTNVAIVTGLNYFIPWMFSLGGADRYITPCRYMGLVGIAIMFLKRLQIYFFPMPEFPHLLGDDEKVLCSQFGVSTLEQCGEVVGMSRLDFLKLAASSKIEDQKKVIELFSKQESFDRLLQVRSWISF